MAEMEVVCTEPHGITIYVMGEGKEVKLNVSCVDRVILELVYDSMVKPEKGVLISENALSRNLNAGSLSSQSFVPHFAKVLHGGFEVEPDDTDATLDDT